MPVADGPDRDLLSGPIGRTLLSFALPTLASSALQSASGSLVIVLMLLARPALTLFVGEDSAALPIAVHIVRLSTWGFVAFGVALVLFGTVWANAGRLSGRWSDSVIAATVVRDAAASAALRDAGGMPRTQDRVAGGLDESVNSPLGTMSIRRPANHLLYHHI